MTDVGSGGATLSAYVPFVLATLRFESLPRQHLRDSPCVWWVYPNPCRLLAERGRVQNSPKIAHIW